MNHAGVLGLSKNKQTQKEQLDLVSESLSDGYLERQNYSHRTSSSLHAAASYLSILH